MQYFRLRDIYYAINEQSITINKLSETIKITIKLNGTTSNNSVDKALRNVYLQIDFENPSINLYDLHNKKFKFDMPDAGKFNTKEENQIEMSKIHITNLENEQMTIHWTGEVSLPINKKYGKHIPFDIEFKHLIKEQKGIR